MGDKEEKGQDDYTQDGTVDLRGNPIRRSKRGGWTACSFVVGIFLNFSFLFVSFHKPPKVLGHFTPL